MTWILNLVFRNAWHALKKARTKKYIDFSNLHENCHT